MNYHKANFTLFDKNTLFAKNIQSPTNFHQLVIPPDETIISDTFGQPISVIPPNGSALIYPLLKYHLIINRSKSPIELLSINGKIFDNQLFLSDFFSEVNTLLKRTDISILLLDKSTTKSLRLLYHKLTNDYKLEYMVAILDMLHLIAHSKGLVMIQDTTDNEKQRLFFNQINEYIEKNISSNIEIKEISAEFYLSESIFSHRFRKIFNSPFHHYLLGKKIEKSCELLQNAENSVQDIAYLLGFNSTSHFISKFKQLKGVTPGNYRSIL